RPWVTVKHQRRIDRASEHTTTPRNSRNARHHHKARSEGLRKLHGYPRAAARGLEWNTNHQRPGPERSLHSGKGKGKDKR
ncbi:MAG: hypothetical protein AB7S36_18970, partial [Planctomycetota bacterium]